LLYSPRWLFLMPGLILMIAGMIVGGVLIRGPLKIGAVTFDVHTLWYAALAVLLGFQSISFGVFTKIFAIGEGLLPSDPRLSKAFKVITLEVGLVLGTILVLIGLGGS